MAAFNGENPHLEAVTWFRALDSKSVLKPWAFDGRFASSYVGL